MIMKMLYFFTIFDVFYVFDVDMDMDVFVQLIIEY